MENSVVNINAIKDQINAEKKKVMLLTTVLALGVFVIGTLSIALGRADISVMDVWKIIFAKIFYMERWLEGISEYKVAIVWDIRIPRILIGTLVGAGLAVAGTVFQAILRNPLADPYTIGVSTGAAFGAVVIIYINLFFSAIPIPVMPFAFAGALLSLVLVIKISKKNGQIQSTNLIIAGIIVSSILSAGISFLKSAAGEQVSAIVYWLMGSLAARSWNHVAIAFPMIVGGILLCQKYSDNLDIMSLGEREANALGVDTKKTMRVYLVVGSVITAVCVSVSGIIGFIGLIIPHLIRYGVSTKNRYLIPLSAFAGASLLMVADNFSRLTFDVEIPVGVLTTLLGGPFFIYIFAKRDID